MPVILDGSDLYLSGSVGPYLFDDYFSFSEVMMAFLEVGRGTDLTIHLNSPGGYTDEGAAIANAITARPGRTTVVVEGIAFSAATYLASAADEVVMADGSLWMIHEPMTSLFSANSEALASAVQHQKLQTDAYAAAYRRRTGRSEAQIREWMRAETYFGPDEAVEAGFADRKSADVVDLVAVAPAWDYPGTYDHAPARLVAVAQQKKWHLPASRLAAVAPAPADTSAPQTQKEGQMSDPTNAPAPQNAPAPAPQNPGGQGAGQETPGGGNEGQQPAQNAPVEQNAPAQQNAPVEQPQSDVEKAVAAERQRAADIHATCTLGGRPNDASGFIADGKSLSEVVAALNTSRGSAPVGSDDTSGRTTAAGEISTRHGGTPSDAPLRVDLAADMRRRTGQTN